MYANLCFKIKSDADYSILLTPAQGSSFSGSRRAARRSGGGWDRSAVASAAARGDAAAARSSAMMAAGKRASCVTMGSPRPRAVRSGASTSANP